MDDLTDAARRLVEAEVRKVLGLEDVKLRQVWADEAKNYRDFLQNQFKWITIGVSVLGAVGAGLFVWFFSDNVKQLHDQLSNGLTDAKTAIQQTVDSKVIEYRIGESLKATVATMVESAVGSQVDKVTKDTIQPAVAKMAETAVSDIANKKIDAAVETELAKIKELNLDDILKHAALPAGAVVAFSQACPEGWSTYAPAVGRTIIGAGQSGNLTLRSTGDTGGAETHTLMIDELPPQEITIDGLVGVSRVDRYNAGGADYPVVGKARGTQKIGGTAQPFSVMPPYIVLYFCQKS